MVSQVDVEQMVEMLAAQDRKLRDLEAKLQKEKRKNENLEVDFQHLLDQIHMIGGSTVVLR